MLTDKVIRTAFIVSLTGHCLLLSIPGINIISTRLNTPKEVTIKIEIEKPSLLPKIDVMGEEKKLKEAIKKPKSKPEPKEKLAIEQSPEEPIEENIKVIDPSQEAMLRYQDMVKQKIEEARTYPSWAKRREIEGVVYLNFIVSPNGLSRNIKIIRSSDSKILDEKAIQIIKKASPFPPIPQELNQDFVSMKVAIVFKMK